MSAAPSISAFSLTDGDGDVNQLAFWSLLIGLQIIWLLSPGAALLCMLAFALLMVPLVTIRISQESLKRQPERELEMASREYNTGDCVVTAAAREAVREAVRSGIARLSIGERVKLYSRAFESNGNSLTLEEKHFVEGSENNNNNKNNKEDDPPSACLSLDGERQICGTCLVCFDEFAPGDKVVRSEDGSCPHLYHKKCMVGYLARNAQKKDHAGAKRLSVTDNPCPACRTSYLAVRDDDLAKAVLCAMKSRQRAAAETRKRARTTTRPMAAAAAAENDDGGSNNNVGDSAADIVPTETAIATIGGIWVAMTLAGVGCCCYACLCIWNSAAGISLPPAAFAPAAVVGAAAAAAAIPEAAADIVVSVALVALAWLVDAPDYAVVAAATAVTAFKARGSDRCLVEKSTLPITEQIELAHDATFTATNYPLIPPAEAA